MEAKTVSSVLDLIIMRVAIFEMTSPELEVPQTVALNEALKSQKYTVTKISEIY